MARIRTLKPAFWDDPAVCKLTRDGRLTALAVISYADDRGRLEFSAPAIRGYAFRRDNVTDRRVHGWLVEVVNSGMALAYEADEFAYLWLPKFWRHQIINRPTESQLPPHPQDPYGHLEIREALAKFREDSLSDSVSDSLSPHGGLTTSRAGARSLPFLSSPEVDVPNSNDKGNSNPGRRPSKPADQDTLPDALPSDLHDAARRTHPRLLALQSERGGDMPTLRGVGLAMARFPDRDHAAVLAELEHWALAGRGRNRAVKDWARTFATFLDGSTPSRPSRPASGAAAQVVPFGRKPSPSDLIRDLIESEEQSA